MRGIYKIAFFGWCLLSNAISIAQNKLGLDEKPEMAIGMRSNGKIYVVVAVLVTILLGIVLYLTNLDRKIRRLEKEVDR